LGNFVQPKAARVQPTASRYSREMPAQRDRSRAPLPPLVLIFGAWLVPALLSGIDTYMQDRLQGHPAEWRWVAFNSVDWLAYAVLTPFVFRMSRRVPLERPHLGRNISIHVAGALGLCVAWASMGMLMRVVIFPAPDGNASKVLHELVSWTFTTLPFGVGVYFALVGIEHSLFYFAEARERETQAARLAAQLAEARLGALRMQLNPHFLFNSLNAITVLVRDQNTAAASRMLELLSDVLRQVLRGDDTHETTLAVELDFLERFLAIEQVRFSDRLQPRIEVEPGVEQAAVPRFLLQPLVENAVRHGISQRADAGEITITARREGAELVLMVRDDGPGLATALKMAGVGLANTRARLAALYGEGASLEIADDPGGGVVATVRIPYHFL